ncbi:MAG: AAA family ATPase, partial [Rhodospirillaceae bacterium]|nr:AAA family ATPase [Rhodospirillaceae bacterium]
MSDTQNDNDLHRIAEALERISPASPPVPDFSAADAFVWHADNDRLEPVHHVNRIPLALLKGIDGSR